jgi:hypothetical protein
MQLRRRACLSGDPIDHHSHFREEARVLASSPVALRKPAKVALAKPYTAPPAGGYFVPTWKRRLHLKRPEGPPEHLYSRLTA